MKYLKKFQDKLKQSLANQFIRNLSWLGASEIIIRISRLLTTFVLARFLSKYDYGLAAIVLATHEFVQVFSRNGIAAKLIQADAEELPELCDAAYWLNWVVFSALFVIQCLAAFPVAWFYGDNNLILPICALGLTYLMIPFSNINSCLIRRENRLQIRALAHTVGISTGNILSLILAYLGMGIWAIVLPQILVAPLWLYIYLIYQPWRPRRKFNIHRWKEIFDFGRSILGVELLDTLRKNLDYLLIGRFLGISQLGIYYFAFNAGLGISLSIISAIKSAILPHLCSLRTDWHELQKQYYKSIKIIALIIIPVVLLQSNLAPFYVPIVFGEKWIEAIPILMIICLSAIPRPFGDAASQLLVALGRPDLDLRWNIIFTVIFTLSLLVGVQWQSMGVAVTVLVVHLVAIPGFTVWATRYAFKASKI
ncbi:lipopolysaccharide biosynthesis protein [Oscillatoria salina]|uniref:lipopolysaccharide biosynthesis protein n=1 Tax=Oscillatoria salina TaxID=331517 RepID=UPI0013B7F62B|nr:lipopolysaccharide biosynthesis protein [Oscillatoria salina]MBZ8181006.1 lipopolysaccharide biosynthesis protein [Oscillatoria salina IIICB1]NET88127.1 lipopolysaccharide biosynthesis protein [Kamptonema sp. SIO1D9]